MKYGSRRIQQSVSQSQQSKQRKKDPSVIPSSSSPFDYFVFLFTMKFSLSIVTILSLVGAITAVPPPAGQPAGQEQKQKDPPLVPLTVR